MIEIKTEADLNDLFARRRYVVVDFWAPWCGPCKALAPTFEEIATETQGDEVYAKANCDDVRDIAVKYGVRSIPTIVIFENGQPTASLSGLKSKEEYVTAIQQVRGGC